MQGLFFSLFLKPLLEFVVINVIVVMVLVRILKKTHLVRTANELLMVAEMVTNVVFFCVSYALLSSFSIISQRTLRRK